MVKKEKKAVKKEVKTKKETKLLDLSDNGLKEIIDYFETTNIAELGIKEGSKKITIRKDASVKPAAEVNIETTGTEDESNEEYVNNNWTIHSTYVGLYKPVKDICVGADVKKGQIIADIYSMNLDHNITADEDCTIEKILIEEDDPVEYGKPLFIVS